MPATLQASESLIVADCEAGDAGALPATLHMLHSLMWTAGHAVRLLQFAETGLRRCWGCRARAWVASELDFKHDAKLSLFETVIRVVGGLLSAYDASHDAMFLAKAEQLASIALFNFNDDGTGMHLLSALSRQRKLKSVYCMHDPWHLQSIHNSGRAAVGPGWAA